MTANKVKVRKIDEDESQMDDDENSTMNLTFKIAAQFLSSNQCGRLAQARLIYPRKTLDFFFSSNDCKQSQSPKNWWRWISDGWWWKNLSWIFHLKLLHNFFHQISGDSWQGHALSISRKCRIFFLVKWRQTKSKSEKFMMMTKSIMNLSIDITR